MSDWKPKPAPSWDDLWNEASRLRAALSEAQRERDEAVNAYAEICDSNTAWKHIIARVGEAEKLYAAMKDKLSLAEIALATRDTAFEAETARAERAEAALAEAERKYHQNLTELAQVHLKELGRRDANLAAALERQK